MCHEINHPAIRVPSISWSIISPDQVWKIIFQPPYSSRAYLKIFILGTGSVYVLLSGNLSWKIWKIAMGEKKGPGRLSLADLGIQSRFNKDMNLNKS